VLQGLLKKIEIGRLLSDKPLQFRNPRQGPRKLVARQRPQRVASLSLFAPRTPDWSQRRRSAHAELLLPLIQAFARNPQLA
jgi:hypothetical protein